jgi:hypothetical protein
MMPAKANPRNHRNNPYMLDPFMASMHSTAAGVLWRFRTEAATVTGTAAGFWGLARAVTLVQAAIITATIVALLAALPWTRRFIIRRAWCILSRHRIQKVCFETRMHTRSGRLPLVLRIHPTQVGERALLWCRAGICFEDFEAHTGEIAAACYAREARVERSKRWAQLVQVDIVRRDTLGARHVITPALAPAVPIKRREPNNIA